MRFQEHENVVDLWSRQTAMKTTAHQHERLLPPEDIALILVMAIRHAMSKRERKMVARAFRLRPWEARTGRFTRDPPNQGAIAELIVSGARSKEPDRAVSSPSWPPSAPPRPPR